MMKKAGALLAWRTGGLVRRWRGTRKGVAGWRSGPGGRWSAAGVLALLLAGGRTALAGAAPEMQEVCARGGEVLLRPGQQYAMKGSETVSCPVRVSAGSRITVPDGMVLTLTGGLEAPAAAVFDLQGTGRVRFGTATPEVPVEWFGAVGDYDLGRGTGTDDTRAIQAALDSLTAGHAVLQPRSYRVTGTLEIRRSSIGLRGTSAGYSYPANSPVSLLVATTAGADVLRLTGTPDRYLVWNDLRDFSVQRSVLPTGTATGIALSFAGGYTIDHVQVQDSVRAFYLHAAPNYGVGSVANSNAGWGYAGVTGYKEPVYGFYLDSEDGVAENTIFLHNIGTSNNAGAGFLSYGMFIAGKAINDVDVAYLGTAQMSYGVYVRYDGPKTGTLSAYDLHFHNVTIDSSTKTGVYVSGLAAGAEGMIDFSDGWVTSVVPGVAASFDCEASSGLTISKVQIIAQDGNGVMANGCRNLAISGNIFSRTAGSFVLLRGTDDSVVSGNVFRGEKGFATRAMVSLSGSSRNTVLGNTLTGPAAVGIAVDATSRDNSFGGNTMDPAEMGTAVRDDSPADGASQFRVPQLSAGAVAVPPDASSAQGGASVGVAGSQPEFQWYVPTAGANARRVRMRASLQDGRVVWALEANSDDGQAQRPFMTFGLTPGAAVQASVPMFPAGLGEPLRTPASSSSPCTVGQFEDDARFHYVCVAPNRWKRVELHSF